MDLKLENANDPVATRLQRLSFCKFAFGIETDILDVEPSTHDLEYFRGHGQHFPRPVFPYTGRCGQLKQCYKNATDLTWQRPPLPYVQGFILYRPTRTVYAHAFNVAPDGRALDSTLEDTRDHEYFGVILERPLLYDLQLLLGTYDWYHNIAQMAAKADRSS